MKIDRKATTDLTKVDRVPPPQTRPAGTRSHEGRLDRVEISEAGRRANQELEAAIGPTVHPVPADAPDRLDQIRARVKSGFYIEEQVLFSVAREIVIRGEHRF